MKDITFFRTAKDIRPNWLMPAAYSLIFLVLAYFALIWASGIVQDAGLAEAYAKLGSMSESVTEDYDAALEQSLADAVEEFNAKFSTVMDVTISFYAYLVVSYSILWFFVYRSTYRNKLKNIIMLKFTAFNIVAVTAALALIICAVVALKTSAALVIVPILMLIIWYIFTFFNIIFFKEGKVFPSIKKLYIQTITRFNRLIPAFGWSFLAFIALFAIAYFLAMIPAAGSWLSLLPLVVWLTFTRYYLINIYKKQSLKMIDIKVLKKEGK
jgi:hypothetical protein